jgi:alpha-glucosidase
MVNLSLDKKLSDLEKIFGVETAMDSIGYTILRENLDSKYFPKELPSIPIEGPILNFSLDGNSILVEFKKGFLSISAIDDRTIYMKWSLNYINNEDHNQNRFDNVLYDDKFLTINIGYVKLVLGGNEIDYYSKDEIVRKEFLPSIGSRNLIISNIREDSILSGTGERALPLNLRGYKINIWNHDANGSYGPGDDPLYINIPLLMDVHHDNGYTIFFNNPAKGEMDICSEFKNIVKTEFIGGELNYYVTFGTMKDMMSQMTHIVGKPLLPPKWALGYHQSRYSYSSQKELEEIYDKFQELGLPLSAIHLDIDYMDGYRIFTVDKKNFPNLRATSERMNKNGTKLVAILDPGVKWDKDFKIYREGIENGYFIKDPEGNIIKGPVWPGNSAFPDFSDDEVRKWWASKYIFFKENGITGVWHDMNEPAIFVFWGDNSLPLSAVQYEGFHYLVHNKYGLQMAAAGYNGLLNITGGQRPFILSRSGWAGIQKYAFVWTGDTESSWKELRQTIPTILNLGLSGIPFSGVDIGGFSGNPSEELFIRWFELSSLFPFFRNHSAKGTRRREPWTFSENALNIIKKYLNLRYMLIPYLFSVAYESHSKGFPFIRPVCMEYPDICSDDVFLIGNSLFAIPVLKRGLRKVRGTLPPGRWYYFWDDTICEGNIDINVNIEDIPLFVKEGSIIPMERDGLEFHVFPGNLDEFVFYDDDSRVEPKFIKIEFKMENREGGFIITWNYNGELMNEQSELKFIIHKEGKEIIRTSKINDSALYFT